MKRERIDTDGILDRCHCGEIAKFIHDWKNRPKTDMARCTVCGEATDWLENEMLVMLAWNKAMRSYGKRVKECK